MSQTIQHISVLLLVAGCVLWVLRGVWKTLRLRSGGIGKCCERGCSTQADLPGRAQTPEKQRVIFVPVENLTKSGKRA